MVPAACRTRRARPRPGRRQGRRSCCRRGLPTSTPGSVAADPADQQLIRSRGSRVAVHEADGGRLPSGQRWVRVAATTTAEEALRGFERFPTWMWRSARPSTSSRWLRDRNSRVGGPGAGRAARVLGWTCSLTESSAGDHRLPGTRRPGRRGAGPARRFAAPASTISRATAKACTRFMTRGGRIVLTRRWSSNGRPAAPRAGPRAEDEHRPGRGSSTPSRTPRAIEAAEARLPVDVLRPNSPPGTCATCMASTWSAGVHLVPARGPPGQDRRVGAWHHLGGQGDRGGRRRHSSTSAS